MILREGLPFSPMFVVSSDVSQLAVLTYGGLLRAFLPAKTLRFLSRFGILRSRVKSESRNKEGGCNDYVRPPFFIVNAR